MTGDELSAWMNAHSYSTTDLGNTLGVDMATIWRWRNGKSPIPPYLHLALWALQKQGVTNAD